MMYNMDSESRFMKDCYGTEIPEAAVDLLMVKWLCLYIVARDKCGNYNFDDKEKVVNDYIFSLSNVDFKRYLQNLKSSGNIKDENEFTAIQNCTKYMPLYYWTKFKEWFNTDDVYFEQRLKYNFDNIMKQIQKRD